MGSVWNFIIATIQFVVTQWQRIPVWSNEHFTVYLWHFEIALLILTIIVMATVSTVSFAPANAYSMVRVEAKERDREAKQNVNAEKNRQFLKGLYERGKKK